MDESGVWELDKLVAEHLRNRMTIVHYAVKIDVSASAVPIRYKGRTFLVTAWHHLDSDNPGGVCRDAIRFGMGNCDESPYETVDANDRPIKIFGCTLQIKDMFSNERFDIAAMEVDEQELLEKLGCVPFEENQLDSTVRGGFTITMFGYPKLAINENMKQFSRNGEAITEHSFDAAPTLKQTTLREKPHVPFGRKVNQFDFFLSRSESDSTDTVEFTGFSGGGVVQLSNPGESNIFDTNRHMRLVGIQTAVNRQGITERYFRCTSIEAVKQIIDKKMRV